MTIDGATDAEASQVYVEQVLSPTRRPREIVIMDNLRAHNILPFPLWYAWRVNSRPSGRVF